jgi:hypothetical protein
LWIHATIAFQSAIGAELTKQEIIAKTLKDVREHQGIDRLNLEYEEDVITTFNELLPDGDIKTCEDFKHFNVECCDTCHGFLPETEMYLVDLPEGGKAWICCPVHSELFPETKVDKSNPEQKLLEWVRAGNKLGDYCGFVPPELLQKIMDAGLLDVGDSGAEPEDEE